MKSRKSTKKRRWKTKEVKIKVKMSLTNTLYLALGWCRKHRALHTQEFCPFQRCDDTLILRQSLQRRILIYCRRSLSLLRPRHCPLLPTTPCFNLEAWQGLWTYFFHWLFPVLSCNQQCLRHGSLLPCLRNSLCRLSWWPWFQWGRLCMFQAWPRRRWQRQRRTRRRIWFWSSWQRIGPRMV